MRKIGGLVLIAAALTVSACTAPAGATPRDSPTISWETVQKDHPSVVEAVKKACGSIDASTKIEGADAATIRRIADEYCPR